MPTTSVDVLARLSPAVPAALAAKAASWPADREPVAPRLSASVVLVRQASDELEVYLLHRHARMAFAASMVVFPGGGLDPVDEGADDPIRACAVRETLEETGVRLEPAALRDWAHWVTPQVEPRRFDTRFFLGVLPAGQRARDVSGETERAAWTTPADALAAAERGEIGLMPPTLSILVELADAGTVPELLQRAADRRVLTVRPRLVRDGDGWRFSYPSAEDA
ncbi:NUDIX hydrolase [Microlunatus ginsengisoli]|uniref:Nudix hydrolase domain-containing protein n=1 Tax=Microlunatus ginsengisoli TaxID=363863 RepID=A0ABP7ANV2_9ACTN